MLSKKQSRYHYCISQYRKTILIKGLVRIQEYSSDTGDRVEYRTVLIQEIGTNTRKWYRFEKQYK